MTVSFCLQNHQAEEFLSLHEKNLSSKVRAQERGEVSETTPLEAKVPPQSKPLKVHAQIQDLPPQGKKALL